MQQVHHCPQVAALFDVDLEQVAEIVERRSRRTEQPLLFDGGGLCVALHHNQPTQIGAELARHLLPDGLTLTVAEADSPVRLGFAQKDAPAVLGHFDVAEMGPALSSNVDGGAQVNVLLLKP